VDGILLGDVLEMSAVTIFQSRPRGRPRFEVADDGQDAGLCLSVGEVGQKPDEDGYGQDDRAGPPDEETVDQTTQPDVRGSGAGTGELRR
jgi:hypothetical protein